MEQSEQEKNLIIADHFDSGVSSEEESNFYQTTRSNLSTTNTPFWQNSFSQVDNSKIHRDAYRQTLVN